MAKVWIPGLLREHTGGKECVIVPGNTVRQVIDALETEYPGIKDRLVEDNRLRPSIAVAVDGHVSSLRLRHKLNEDSEIHFLPAISGG